MALSFILLPLLFSVFLLLALPPTVLAAHLTYILPSPPLLAERGDFSYLVTHAAGILTFRLHKDNDFFDLEDDYKDEDFFYKGSEEPNCLIDGSLCSLTTNEYKITLIRSGDGGSETEEHATLDISTFINGDVARLALCDLVTSHLHKYLYGIEEEDLTDGGKKSLDVDHLPVFSIVSDAAKDDLSSFLSALTPKNLLVRKGTNEIWTDDRDVRRLYHYGLITLSCTFQRDTRSCTPFDADVIQAEAFVHPALNSHVKPKQVLFVGPNPYLAVREALKYESVDEVVVLGNEGLTLSMIEKFMGETYLPDIEDTEEERVSFHQKYNAWEIIAEEAKKSYEMIENRKEADLRVDDDYQRKIREIAYDVIFVQIPNVDSAQYTSWLSYEFQYDLRELLYCWTKDGIMVINIGSEPSLNGEDHSDLEAARSGLLHMFMEKDTPFHYSPMMIYDEPRAAPYDTSFIVLFLYWPESHKTFIRQNAGAITLSLVRNLKNSALPNIPTKFYDGTTHKNYQRPSRSWEEWSCRYPPFNTHKMCTTYRPQLFDKNGTILTTYVNHDKVKGRSLHASEFIPAGKFIHIEDFGSSLYVDFDDWNLLDNFIKKYPEATMYAAFRDMVVAYGYQSYSNSRGGWSVAIASVNTFTNHGCTNDEQNTGGMLLREDEGFVEFSQLLSRHMEIMHNGVVARRDIQKDEEILQDYTEYRDAAEDPAFREFLSVVCDNHIGLVPVDEDEDDDDDSEDDDDE
eukprot:CAMPEP_0194328236 /NCGR_PEP_ID=MMETSP0171-20130528/43973_1 /TAXON_ID=218684 /ORGANISM="Corethron pennatum, Strain L29A3" /LENGTH=740 /DNA_ID=CAMNT_0039088491 /DNA_START=82 /DNA_END=2304 /DNA_ORIENTATION=-